MNTISKWLTALALLSGPMAAIAQLSSVDGGLGVYDKANNVTWVSDGNLFGTQYAANNGVVAAIIADANMANSDAGLSTGVVSLQDFTSIG